MTNTLELYKCNICGNVAQILVTGKGELICCGEVMRRLEPHIDDVTSELKEKHTPEIIHQDNKTIVQLTKHPMVNEHYIMLLQARDDEKREVYTKFFKPNERVEFDILDKNINTAYSYCNIHELYRN